MGEQHIQELWDFFTGAGIPPKEVRQFLASLPDSSWTARRARKRFLKRHDSLIATATAALVSVKKDPAVKGMF